MTLVLIIFFDVSTQASETKPKINQWDYIRLKELLDNAKEIQVNASIPKFDVEDDILLNDTLKVMGMVDVFDANKADLSGIGTHADGNLFVNRVIHKTHMQVDEKGTKAGAAGHAGP